MIPLPSPFEPVVLTAQVPVLLISLPDQKARRVALMERGIPSNWVAAPFPAVDQRDADPEELRRTVIAAGAGLELLAGEIGCAMSHRQAALWLANSGYDLALVLEDDILPQGPDWLAETISTARALLPYARTGSAFVCLLGARSDQADAALRRPVTWRGPAPECPKLYEHVDPDRTLWRAHAYLISRAAAERSREREVRIATLADDWGARLKLGLIDALFYTRPVLIAQDEESVSTIDPHQQRRRADHTLPKRGNLSLRIAQSLAFRAMMARAHCRARCARRLPSPE